MSFLTSSTSQLLPSMGFLKLSRGTSLCHQRRHPGYLIPSFFQPRLSIRSCTVEATKTQCLSIWCYGWIGQRDLMMNFFLWLPETLTNYLAMFPPNASRISSPRQKVRKGLCLFRQMASQLDAPYWLSKQAQVCLPLSVPEFLLGSRLIIERKSIDLREEGGGLLGLGDWAL